MNEEELNQMSNNELIGIIKAQRFEIKQLENIRKEAIDYIDKLWSFPGGNYEIAINERDSIDIDGNDYFDNLLNILQGSDKE